MNILNVLSNVKILSNYNLNIDLLDICIVMLAFFIIITIAKKIIIVIKKKLHINSIKINQVVFNIGMGTVTVTNNREVSKIAHKAYIEIITRKVGLKFEEDKDVIVEVYDSWYAMFGIIRNLTKDIEMNKYNKDVQKLEQVLIDVLNLGLRPHLTTWQAKFRKWYSEFDANKYKGIHTPQQIQKKYPQYNELISDLKNTNDKMLEFANQLKKLF